MSTIPIVTAQGKTVQVSVSCLSSAIQEFVAAVIKAWQDGTGLGGIFIAIPDIVTNFLICQFSGELTTPQALSAVAPCLYDHHAQWAAVEKKILEGLKNGVSLPAAVAGAIVEIIEFVRVFGPCVLSSGPGDEPTPPSGVPVPGPIGKC